jgi:glycosyltransferase involved in cell wall biosynthesis
VPQFFVQGFREYLKGAVMRAVKRARHILADSESTRRDLMELMGVESERVTVLYPGVEARFQPVKDMELLQKARARYHLPKHFILGLGTLQPRKNFDGLIQAYQRVLAARSSEHSISDLALVIVGGKGWLYEETLALAERLGLSERVHFIGFVSDEDLPSLYSLASVLAFPSWYEGFGLPVLEAMACGIPVVAADNSSLPEVVGEAGLMVSAGDVDALADALVRLLSDEPLRAHLVAAGREQARRFTWEDGAARLRMAYGSALKSRGSALTSHSHKSR